MTANRFGLTADQLVAKRRGLVRGVTYREATDTYRIQVSGHPEETRRDKREAMARWAELKSGRAAAPKAIAARGEARLTVAKYARQYVIEERADLKASTRRGYLSMIDTWLGAEDGQNLTVLGGMRLADVDRQAVNGYLVWLAKQHGEIKRRDGTTRPLSYARVDAVRHLLSGIFRHAIAEKLVTDFTMPKTPKYGAEGAPLVKTAEVIVPTDDEIDALFGSLKGEQHEVLLWTLRLTGMRIGEALALKRQHLKLGAEPSIDIRGTLDPKTHLIDVPKTPRSVRTVAIPDELAKLLQAHLDRQDALPGPTPIERLVFTTKAGGALWHEQVLKAFARIQRQTGVTAARAARGVPPLTPHDLRHHFVTNLIAHDVTTEKIADYIGDLPRQISKTYGHYIMRSSRDVAAATARSLRASDA